MTVLTLRKYSIEEKLKKAGMEATKSVVTSGGIPSYTKSTIYDHVARGMMSSKIWRVLLQGKTFFCFYLLSCGLFLYYHKVRVIHGFKLKSNLQKLMQVEGNFFRR